MSANDGQYHNITTSLVETIPQDTIRKYDIKKVDKNLTEKEMKELKDIDRQRRSEQIDQNMMRLQKQSILMDSLLGKPDTTKIIK